MEKTEITWGRNVEEPIHMPNFSMKKNRDWRMFPKKAELAKLLLFCVVGTLWGRSELFGILHPLGMTYISLFFGEGILFWSVFLVTGVGAMIDTPLKTGAALAAAAAIQLTLGRFVNRDERVKKAFLGAFSMGLAGVFYGISKGGLTFYFAVAAVESALVLGISLLTQMGVFFIWEKRRVPIPAREEGIALIILLGGALAGISRIPQDFFGEGILFAVLAATLLLAAWKEGIGGGAAAGSLLGVILYFGGAVNMTVFAVLSLSGMLAGCGKDLGRWVSGLILALSPLIFLFYVDSALIEPIWVWGWFAGVVIFLVVPKKVVTMLGGGLWEQEKTKDIYSRKKELMEEKLADFAGAFRSLSKSFVKEAQEQEKTEVSRLVDDIAARTCGGCGMAHYCWEEELYATYSMTFSALSHCESKGYMTWEQLPEAFCETCARKDVFVDSLNKIYETYRRDRVWLGRLDECRDLVSQQLLAVGGILDELSEHMELGVLILEAPTQMIRDECTKLGIRTKDIRVTEEKKGNGRRVKLSLRGCGGKRACKEKLPTMIRKTMGIPMTLLEEGNCHCGNDGVCHLTFMEAPAFSLMTAVAFLAANEGEPCGDTSTFFETDEGTALMALSDGMGHGARAALESRTAIELLEQFTQAGFERELAVKMINSALLFRNCEENYATLDICAVDLFGARAEFIKMGAVSSYIYRGGRVLSISAHTLPAGILKQVQVEKNEMLLKDGDMIYIFSDGISDALGGEHVAGAWLKEKLEKFPVANPQDAAQYVLQEAKRACKTETHDDMTVMVGRFWRKRKYT